MKSTLNRLIKIISGLLLLSLIAGTIWFTYVQIVRSQVLDEALVSDLTTQLETGLIDQAIDKINAPVTN